MEPSRALPRPRWRGLRWLASLLLALGLLGGGLLVPAPAHAATITVNTIADENNTGVGCSLREAIVAANSNGIYGGCPAGNVSGTDTIVLQAGQTYDLTLNDGDTTIGPTGLPTITSQITIQGNGAIVRRGLGGQVPDFRIFRVGGGSGVLALTNLTVRNGRMTRGGTSRGGGIYNEGVLQLTDVTLTDHIATATAIGGAPVALLTEGGAIYTSGTLTITGGSLSGQAIATAATTTTATATGGGIHGTATSTVSLTNATVTTSAARATSSGTTATATGGGLRVDGSLTLTTATITTNTAAATGGTGATAGGGGVYAVTLTATTSTISDNHANALTTTSGTAVGNGAGLDLAGGLATITGGTIASNTATAAGQPTGGALGGGVIANVGTSLTMTNTTLRDNLLSGGTLQAGGGLLALGATVTISGSTISGNTVSNATPGVALDGGGLFLTAGTATIANSTISGNAAVGNTTGSGGGLATRSSNQLTLVNATITNNQATVGGGGLSHSASGAGSTTLTNSIIAGNTVNTSLTAATADCQPTAPITSGGHNLTGAGTGCPTSGAGDLTVAPANVAGTVLTPTLANNGGPTLTHALPPGSPAIDAAADAVCAASPINNLDQRGQARPTDGDANGINGCDIGAYEAPTRTSGALNWYFAEGYTGTGFDEYLTIQNPNTLPAEVTITYNRTGLPPVLKSFTVPAGTRDTVNVHETARGVGRVEGIPGGVSALVQSTNGVGLIVERPMYFIYNGDTRGIPGGHNVMGATAPRPTWYVAEGFTATGFDEYLTIQNPNPSPAVVDITYYLTGAAPQTRQITVPASQRYTVVVHQTGEGVGRNGGAGWPVAAKLTTTNPGGIIVERPMYVTYTGGGAVWREGHNVMGAAGPRPTWFFPGGDTTPGTDTYLTLLNPTPRDILTTLTYYVVGDPVPQTRSLTVPPTSRATVAVHGESQGVGRGKQVAITVAAADAEGLVVERPIYTATGATNVLGAPAARPTWFFAEGYTGPGFAESLIVFNPNNADSAVKVTYYLASGPPVIKTLTVGGQRRVTIDVNGPTLGVGANQAVSARVETTNGVSIVVERPMTFTYNGTIQGAHTVIGYAP